MCSGCGAPGKRTIGNGKMGSSRAIGDSIDAKTGRRRAVGRKHKWPGKVSWPLAPSYRYPSIRLPVWSLRRPPESLQRPAVWGFPQLLKRPFAYLPDALPRHSHQRPDLLERHGLAAFLEPVIEVEDLALARREVLLEDPVDELAHQLAVGLLLDLAALLACEPLAQRGRVLVAAVHRRVQRQLGGRHAAGGADVFNGVFECESDFVVGRFAAQLL